MLAFFLAQPYCLRSRIKRPKFCNFSTIIKIKVPKGEMVPLKIWFFKQVNILKSKNLASLDLKIWYFFLCLIRILWLIKHVSVIEKNQVWFVVEYQFTNNFEISALECFQDLKLFNYGDIWWLPIQRMSYLNLIFFCNWV